jgi:hypothetical protein
LGSNGTENRLKESRRGSDDHVPGAHRVMLHNVVDLIKVLNEMINEGHEVTPECVQRLSLWRQPFQGSTLAYIVTNRYN